MLSFHAAAYFLIFSFGGWVLEVAYHAVCKGKIVNRGFLNGPVCPIYGLGMISVVAILVPTSDNLVLLFFGGILFATLIELVGGWILFRAFHMRWWDYSNEPFNLGGYICLKFSLAWGICIVIVVRVIQPIIKLNVGLMDNPVGYILVGIGYAIFAVDFVATVLTVTHLNHDLEQLNSMAKEIHNVSDALTDVVAHSSLDVNDKVVSAQVQATLGRYEMQEKMKSLGVKAPHLTDVENPGEQIKAYLTETAGQLSERKDQLEKTADQLREKLSKGALFGYGRIYQAFPQLNHKDYNEELKKLIEKIKN